MISVKGYTPNPENTEWKFRREGHQGNNKDARQHAERVVFGMLPKSVSAYLLVQSAFPCSICHGHFLEQSAVYDIIIKVTDDEGKYSNDHKANCGGKQPGIPQIIYYHGGAAKYVGVLSIGNDDPPHGFCAHPDFEDLD